MTQARGEKATWLSHSSDKKKKIYKKVTNTKKTNETDFTLFNKLKAIIML